MLMNFYEIDAALMNTEDQDINHHFANLVGDEQLLKEQQRSVKNVRRMVKTAKNYGVRFS